MNAKQITYPLRDRWSYLWLVIGTAMTLFSTGQWTIPLLIWLGGIFVIRFMRTQPVWRGYLLVWLTNYVVVSIAWWNILGYGMPLPMFLITMGISTLLIGALPYLADRLLVPHLPGFAATLVYPLGVTAIEFLTISTNPLGSFGGQAYTQANSLVLMQLLSVTGMWGITFLVTWFATVVNYAWERSFSWTEIWRGVAIYAGIMLVVVAYGNIRLALFQPEAGTMRVHGVTAVDMRQNWGNLLGIASDQGWDAMRQQAANFQEDYFAATVREARAGAQLVLWPEMAVMVAAEDEPSFLARAQQIASQEGIYLAVGMGTVYQDDSPHEVKLIVFDPTGQIVLEHYKYGGQSLEGFKPGDGILRTAETPYGTISGVICWDTNFHAPVRQAGRNGTDILLSPSLEFRAVDPMHAQMATFRAVENGVSLVRQADNGLSIATDPFGRTLAAVDHFATEDRVMVAQVPSQGVFTLYSVIGDLFSWLAVAGFATITVVGIVRWRREKRSTVVTEEGVDAGEPSLKSTL
jgi:apolipoprotein N-acyltransferase